MSETQEGYGTQNTPVMGESFPPQTGDLLGGYIARLSALVNALEAASTEPSAYQRSLEARIERLESLIERLMARMDVLDNIVEDYITFGCDRNSCQRPEPTAEPAATTPTVTRERTHGRYGTRNLTKSKPDHIVDANKKVCATCGHDEADHLCDGGTLGKPCRCTGYKPVASEG